MQIINDISKVILSVPYDLTRLYRDMPELWELFDNCQKNGIGDLNEVNKLNELYLELDNFIRIRSEYNETIDNYL